MHAWMDIDRQIDIWVDRCMDKQTDRQIVVSFFIGRLDEASYHDMRSEYPNQLGD